MRDDRRRSKNDKSGRRPIAPPNQPVQTLLGQAIQHHQAGRLAEAEQLYREILAVDARQPDSLHLLGVIALQIGNHAAAIDLIGEAISQRDDIPFYHHNLGSALQSQGKLTEAVTRYERAIALKPDYAEAHNNLGNALKGLDKLDAAVAHYERALAISPNYAEAHNNLGNARKAQNKPAEAIAHYQRALALRPDYAEAHNNLGSVFEEQGKLADAMAEYERALALLPNVAEVHVNLGNALRRQGKLAEAAAQYGQALALKPDVAETHNYLGNVLKEQNKLADAVTQYERALMLNPDYADAHNNLGHTLEEQGSLADAASHYQRALALNPNVAEVHVNLGGIFQRQGRFADAIAHYERALALKPDVAEAHNNLGNAFNQQNKLAEAVAHYERALALRPDYAEPHHNLGNVYMTQGRIDEAQRAYERAIELAPRSCLYYRHLFYLKRVVAGDRHLAALEKICEDLPSLSMNDQKELHFALGRAYADLGQHERSFGHIVAGNALKRREIVYDEAGTLGIIDRMASVFTPDLMHARQGVGDPSSVPIFVLGMPRSGTTLVEQILASHSRVFAGGERRDFELGVTDSIARRTATPFPEIVRDLSAEDLRKLGAGYLAAVVGEAPAAARLIDKMPGNFIYSGLIHLALPNARIIHVQRDPIDTCLSCFMLLFETGQLYSYDLRELGRYYRAYARLMDHWRRVLPPGIMLDVRYEDLVADFDQQAHRIVAHCGLEWEDACLDFHQTQRSITTASAIQVRQPIYRTSVGRSGPYMGLLQPLIEELTLGAPSAGTA